MLTHRSYPDEFRCTFRYADGRRCRSSRASHSPDLCHSHARLVQRVSAKPGALQILDHPEDLTTHEGIDRVLARILAALAEGRINSREASLMLHIAEKLRRSLPWSGFIPSAFPVESNLAG